MRTLKQCDYQIESIVDYLKEVKPGYLLTN